MASAETPSYPTDPLSCANTEHFRLSHMVWNAEFDFSSKTICAFCEYKFSVCSQGETPLLLLLDIHGIQVIRASDCIKNRDLKWEVGSPTVLGAPLSIHLLSDMLTEKREIKLGLEYRTSPNATAVQWLAPEQTKGGKHGYVFTQCQTIHARTLVPCQDTPGVKFTYTATLTVPAELTALMGAVPKGEIKDGKLMGQSVGDKVAFSFEQPTPIPSYLIGLAIGNIQCKEIGPRSRVWSEPELLDACAYEFSEIEEFIKCGESIAGPYIWGPCDLLVLPPSYPYGGMEHPCLIFVTPTLLAGDKSLAAVLIHEISHSWTGNLVTCATWDHFWLNEGFTVFLERKIISRLQSEPVRHLGYLNGYNALLDSINRYGPDHEFTKLVPSVKDVDPDDAFSSVPYEKENGLVTTDAFKQFFLQFFSKEAEQGCFSGLDWDKWLYSPGMPAPSVIPSCFDSSLQQPCNQLRDTWLNLPAEQLPTVDASLELFCSLSPLQKQELLSLLLRPDSSLSISHLDKMRTLYKMEENRNSEIRFKWLSLCLRSNWEEMYGEVANFLTEVGRMKFVRPLYRSLYKAKNGRDISLDLFKQHRHTYHNICAIMVSKDLEIS